VNHLSGDPQARKKAAAQAECRRKGYTTIEGVLKVVAGADLAAVTEPSLRDWLASIDSL
jgi:hypothetical protein